MNNAQAVIMHPALVMVRHHEASTGHRMHYEWTDGCGVTLYVCEDCGREETARTDWTDDRPVKRHHICDDMCYSVVTHEHPDYAICDTAQERDRDIWGPDDESGDEFCEEGED